VERRRRGGEVELAPEAIHQQQRRDLADAGLDRPQPDELAVELVQDLLDVRRAQLGVEVDRQVVYGYRLPSGLSVA